MRLRTLDFLAILAYEIYAAAFCGATAGCLLDTELSDKE